MVADKPSVLNKWGYTYIVEHGKLQVYHASKTEMAPKGAFSMENTTGRLTYDNFWGHTYTKMLNVRGRLALAFVVFRDDDSIILEDMATFCGLDISECEDWLELFMKQGYMRPEVRWS